MLNYSLEVKSSSLETIAYPIMLQDYNLIGNLSENREYSTKIVVSNAVGTASSSYRHFCEFNSVCIYAHGLLMF